RFAVVRRALGVGSGAEGSFICICYGVPDSLQSAGCLGVRMAVRANPNLKLWSLMVAGMAIVIIAAMVISHIRQTYSSTVATARRDIEQLSQILDANTDITFQSAEMIIDHALEEINEVGFAS